LTENICNSNRARHGLQQDAGSIHVTTRYDAALGLMDPETLDIANLRAAEQEEWRLQYRATSDEPAVLSMAGSKLLVDNWTRLGGIDVDTGEFFEVANVADEWPECSANCVGRTGPMPFFDSYPFPGPRVGEGRVHRPAVIADGVIYWRVIEGGLAAIGSKTETRSEPVLWISEDPEEKDKDRGSVGHAADLDLQKYVWHDAGHPVRYLRGDLISRLEREIEAIVNAGHMAPFYVQRGFSTGQGIPGDSARPGEGLTTFGPGNVYWFDTGELVYTLSMAYPHLSSDLQEQVLGLLQEEMARYPPLKPLPYPPQSTWLTNGVRRETYPVTILPNVWPPPAPSLSTLYALWTYGHATGNWEYLRAHWDEVDSLFNAKKTAIDTYADIGGAIGYARIARQLGFLEPAEEGKAVAIAGMEAGLDFSAFLETANVRYPDPRGQTTGLRGPVFFSLVPVVGQYLADTNGTAVMAYIDELTDYYDGQFLWHLTRLGVQKAPGETSFHGPDLAWSVFLAEAYVRQPTLRELEENLDRPWALGDLYYLQKLVATIEASGIVVEDLRRPYLPTVIQGPSQA